MHTLERHVGPHELVEMKGEAISTITCLHCHASAGDRDRDMALTKLAKTACAPDCENCNQLRQSPDRIPAVPVHGTCDDHLHICPNDGNRWWQSDREHHLWHQVTDDDEWQELQQPTQTHDPWREI